MANHKYLPLPHTVGLLVMSVAASVVMVAIDLAFPDRHLFESTSTLLQIDFSKVVMDGMLAFLLFAGSLHIDVATLRSRAILRWRSAYSAPDFNGGGRSCDVVGGPDARAADIVSLGAVVRRADQPDRPRRCTEHSP